MKRFLLLVWIVALGAAWAIVYTGTKGVENVIPAPIAYEQPDTTLLATDEHGAWYVLADPPLLPVYMRYDSLRAKWLWQVEWLVPDSVKERER